MGATFHNFGGLQPISVMNTTASGIGAAGKTEKNWAENSTVFVQKGIPATTFARSSKSKDQASR